MNLLRPAVVVRGRAAGSPAATYDRFVAADLPALLTGYGPLPAVTGVRAGAGAWGEVGATRTIRLSDGSAAAERVLVADRPAAGAPGRFAYRVTDYTNALRYFAARADGTWVFAPDGRGGTEVVWTYTFAPVSPWAAPALWPVVAGPLRGYMKRVLRRFAGGPM